jgi:hypothetical protein
MVTVRSLFYPNNDHRRHDPFQGIDWLELTISRFEPVFLAPNPSLKFVAGLRRRSKILPLHLVIIEPHGLVFLPGRQPQTRVKPGPCETWPV